MKLVEDRKAEKWLRETWDGKFQWDVGNKEKLAKHKVTQREIEHLFQKRNVFAGRIIPPPNATWSEEARYLQLGTTPDERTFSVIWTIRETRIRPISCRRQREDEKKRFN
jgi:uncharacterized DUF497 family protein